MHIETEIQQWLRVATEAAYAGGAVLQEWIGRFSVREKSRANLVTEADEAAQAAIVAHLRQAFPDHGFLGEENLHEQGSAASVDGGSNSDSAANSTMWIIDPLDGTTNYVHGMPYYAVSIALWCQGQLQVGVIFDPTRNETFSARVGGGAFLNGRSIQTSGETDISRALAMASLPIAADPEHPAVRRFLKTLPRLQAVQRTGSAALNMAYVAAGRIDAFWSTSLHPWDIAAGTLLVQEAGGIVTGIAGEAIDIFVPNLLAASSRSLQHDLSQVLA